MRSTAERPESVRALQMIAEALNRAIDTATVLEVGLRLIRSHLRYDAAWAYLRTETGQLRLAAYQGLPPALESNDQRILCEDDCVCHQMLHNGKLLAGIEVVECARLERIRQQLADQHPDTIRTETGDLWVHASAPLRSGTEILGILNVARASVRTIPEEDLRVLTVVGETFGVALHRAMLYERLRSARIREQEMLLQLARRLLPLHTLASVAEEVVAFVYQAVGCDAVSLLLPDETGAFLEIVAARGWSAAHIGRFRLPLDPPTHNGVAYAVHMRHPVQEDHMESNQPFSVPEEVRAAGIRICLSIPLLVGDQVIGAIVVDRKERRRFSDDEIRLLTTMAEVIGVALERVRMTHERDTHRRILQRLVDTLSVMVRATDLDEAIRRIVDASIELLHPDRSAVYLRDPDSGELTCPYAIGLRPQYIEFVKAQYRDLPGVRIFEDPRPVVVEDVETMSLPEPVQRRLREEGFRAYAVFPLFHADRVMGALVLYWDRPRRFAPYELHVMETLSHQVAILINRMQEYQATQEAEARYRSLFEGVPVGLFRTTPDGRILDVNPAFVRIFRFPDRATLLKRNAEEMYVNLEDRRRWMEQMEQQDIIRDFEVPVRAYDGQIIWIRETARTIRDDRGRVVAYEGVIEDITDMRRQAIIRKGEREILQKIAENAPLESIYATAIQTVETAFPETIASILLLDEHDRLHVAAAPKLPDTYNRAIDGMPIGPMEGSCGAAAYTGEVVIVTDIDQDSRWDKYRHLVQPLGLRACWSYPFRDTRGRVLGTFALYYRDPRGPEEFELAALERLGYLVGIAVERHRMFTEMERQRQQLQEVMDTVPEGIFLIDADGRVMMTNRTGREILQRLGHPGPGHRLETIGTTPLHEVITRAVQPSGTTLEITDHTHAIYEVAAQPFTGTGVSTAEGWVLVLRDVTRLREIQERAREQERIAAIGQLAAGIAHDLNNVLQAILGYAEIAGMYPDLPEALRSSLAVVQEQSQRAAAMLRQILDFTRASPAEPRPLMLRPFLKEFDKFVRRVIPETIQMTLDLQDNPTVRVDPAQFQQVLMNLVLNARDAMPDGGLLTIRMYRVHVRADTRPPIPEMSPGRWVAIEVVDTGIGIPPEVRPHIFEPFFTTKERGKGTGLGLSQVYGIIQRHGGLIDVESRVGQGTTFRIYLPETEIAEEVQPEETVRVPRGSGQWILVVEDDGAVREMIRTMLDTLGFHVVAVSSVREAKQAWAKMGTGFVLAMVDLGLPDEPGSRFARFLREQRVHIPIIAMTGYPLEEGQLTIRDLWEQGFTGLIAKPFTLQQLADILQRHLRGGDAKKRDAQ